MYPHAITFSFLFLLVLIAMQGAVQQTSYNSPWFRFTTFHLVRRCFQGELVEASGCSSNSGVQKMESFLEQIQ